MPSSGRRAQRRTLRRDPGHPRVHVQRRGEHHPGRSRAPAQGGRGPQGQRPGRREQLQKPIAAQRVQRHQYFIRIRWATRLATTSAVATAAPPPS